MAYAEAAAAADAAEPAANADPAVLPSIFRKAPAYWRRASNVWADKVAGLRASGRMLPGYRSTLMRYCIWIQIYESAAEELRRDLPKGGVFVEWTPVGGTPRKRQHSAVDLMADAETVLRALEAEFGFTPRADADLVRVETFNARQGQGTLPFGAPQSRDGRPPPGADPMNLMNASDSAPPGPKPH